MLSTTTRIGKVISHENLLYTALAEEHRAVSPNLRDERAAVTSARPQYASLVAKGSQYSAELQIHLVFPQHTLEIGQARDKREA